MKAFKFRLQRLLDLRLRQEDLAKNNFSQAKIKLEAEKQSLKKLQESIVTEAETQKKRRKTELVLDSVQEDWFKNYLINLRQNRVEQKLKVDFAFNNLDKKRCILVKASQDREVIEKLKEKQYEAYLEEAAKEEQKALDELVCQKRAALPRTTKIFS